jgi:hypothetical protein
MNEYLVARIGVSPFFGFVCTSYPIAEVAAITQPGTWLRHAAQARG